MLSLQMVTFLVVSTGQFPTIGIPLLCLKHASGMHPHSGNVGITFKGGKLKDLCACAATCLAGI